jgi:vacuolar protein sorting-associated protein 45
MVHELIGIKNNRVSLNQVPGITKELEEVVMNAEYDEFYSNNLYSNFGEIATNIKALMEHFQEKHKSQSKIESIGDMKTFIENYPQFKKLSGTVSKHVTIVSELSRLVGLYHLLEVSETEQHLICQGDHNEVVQKIKRLIKDDKIRDLDILRLLSLYALRYERHASNELNTLKYEAQKHRKFPEKYIQFLQAILEYGGLKFRQADLFNTQTPMAITRQFIRGLRGVDNVYAQHVPLIKDLLEQLLRGKLKDTSYPNVNAKEQINSAQQQGQINKPSEIIVYVIGGITYEESYQIQIMNKQNARILLGGSYVHNFPSFMDEVLAGAGSSLSAASNELLSSKRR